MWTFNYRRSLFCAGAGTTELWGSSQTKAPPLPADVLELLRSTLDATCQQMLYKLQEVNKYNMGRQVSSLINCSDCTHNYCHVLCINSGDS